MIYFFLFLLVCTVYSLSASWDKNKFFFIKNILDILPNTDVSYCVTLFQVL